MRPTWFVNRDLEEAKNRQMVGSSVTPAIVDRNDESSLLTNKARLEGLDQRMQTATNGRVQIHRAMAEMIHD